MGIILSTGQTSGGAHVKGVAVAIFSQMKFSVVGIR